MSKFLLHFGLGLHLISAWGGAAIGGYEAYTSNNLRYFSKTGDDLYKASARGLIRGVYYPYKTLTRVPEVWIDEKPPGF